MAPGCLTVWIPFLKFFSICYVVTWQNWIKRWIKKYFLQLFKEAKFRAKRFLKRLLKRQFRYVRRKQGRQEKLFLIPETSVKKVIILDWAIKYLTKFNELIFVDHIRCKSKFSFKIILFISHLKKSISRLFIINDFLNRHYI